MAKKPTLELWGKLLESKAHNLTQIARACGCSRRAVEKWIEKDARFREAYEDAKRSTYDTAESVARMCMFGFPRYEEKEYVDGAGQLRTRRVQVGWNTYPNVSLLMRYLSSHSPDGRAWRDPDKVKPEPQEGAENGSYGSLLDLMMATPLDYKPARELPKN